MAQEKQMKAAEWLRTQMKDLKFRAVFEFELEAKLQEHGAVTIDVNKDEYGNYSYEINGVE